MTSLPERINRIQVSAFGADTGQLIQPSHFAFSYTHNNPVSITMNYREAPYNYGALHPIFAQNLPEGFVRRYICEKLQRHALVNDMYLLALQFNKGIGHLSYESDIQSTPTEPISLSDILSWRGKEDLFSQLLDRYYLNGLVSGVQPKVLVNAKNDTNKPPERRLVHQEDFIVKTYDDDFPLLTVNEYVCMEAARACGLSPSQCWLSEDLKTFITERFDKTDTGTLAIEDFTVLMGKSGNEKYQSSYEMLMKATRLFTQNQQEIEKMYRYIVFHCLIGNGDAHLKNFSIQYEQSRSTITLTPPYDITHTLIYDTVDDKMALKLDGVKLFPDKAQLMKLGQKHHIVSPEIIIDSYAETIRDYIEQSDEILALHGLKDSIHRALHTATGKRYSTQPYLHDKKRKYE